MVAKSTHFIEAGPGVLKFYPERQASRGVLGGRPYRWIASRSATSPRVRVVRRPSGGMVLVATRHGGKDYYGWFQEGLLKPLRRKSPSHSRSR
jgi:hypothetical protein